MYITDIVYLLDVLVVIVYMSYENWGECSEDWAGGVQVGGGGGVEYLTENFFFAKKCSWGLKTQKTKTKFSFFFPTKFFFQKCSCGSETHANKNLFFGGGGGILGCLGRPKSYHPETLAAEEKKKNK